MSNLFYQSNDQVEAPPPIPSATEKEADGGCLSRLVRFIRCLCDTFSAPEVNVRGCNNANLYAKRGWSLKDTSVKYIYDGFGGFNSYFIFHMKNTSRLFDKFGEAINGNIFKRAIVVGARAISSRINKNPSFSQFVSNGDWRGRVRL